MASFFSGLFKDENLEAIDNQINNLINALPAVSKSIPVDNISGDFVDAFISEKQPTDEIGRLLQGVSIARDRLERYNVYDEAYKYVPIIRRILTVYISNILQKNPVTGKCLLIKESESYSGSRKFSDTDKKILEAAKKLAEDAIKSFNIIIKLRKKFLPNQLIYGDCYCEVVDINAEVAKKSDSNVSIPSQLLFESNSLVTELDSIASHRNGQDSLDRVEQVLSKMSKYYVDVENFMTESEIRTIRDQEKKVIQEQVEEAETEKDEEPKKHKDDETLFDNILLKTHKPHNIISLETEYGTCLGYLVVAKDEIPQYLNLTASLSTLVGRITTIVTKDQVPQDAVVDRLVRYIIRDILTKSQKDGKISNAQSIDDLLKGLDPNVHKYIKRLFVEQGLLQRGTLQNRIRVRFVSASNMVAFTTPSAEFDPYGGSFIDSLIFPCKLYILSQLSNVITKLSRAAPVRKWTIDAGATQMQSGLIQKLKRELYNSRITLEDLSSFKAIPKILSDFKDMFIISRAGQKMVDVEIASHGDPTV